MYETTVESRKLRSLPLNRFHPLDSQPRQWLGLCPTVPEQMPKGLTIDPKILEAVAERTREDTEWTMADMMQLPAVTRSTVDWLSRNSLRAEGTRFTIADVYPREGRIMSEQAFELVVQLARCRNVQPVFVSVVVQWAGEPFVVEQIIAADEAANGVINVHFSKEQWLPAGPAVFLVSLWDAEGGQSNFRTSCAVLPSNPLSLNISPRENFVTGSYSARGVREAGDVFRTRIRLTISNGDSSTVAINRNMSWKFWDGGVGGTLVEGGTHDLGANFTIAANGTWSTWMTVTSPNGSAIYNRYDDKEDMTIEISFSANDGRAISDTLTTRVMVGFGMNVIRVGDASFTSQEYSDLYDAVDVTQEIYEARDVTYVGIGRFHINDEDVGGYDVIDSSGESHDLFGDWSGPDNDFIDVFIVHDHTTGFDGLAGDAPGPTTHAGQDSGVWASKSGYVEPGGTKRLDINYLGMLIGHEVGHYLGLPHTNLSGNLMLSNSGTNDTNLVYDPQYRKIIDYGWVFVV